MNISKVFLAAALSIGFSAKAVTVELVNQTGKELKGSFQDIQNFFQVNEKVLRK